MYMNIFICILGCLSYRVICIGVVGVCGWLWFFIVLWIGGELGFGGVWRI